jgi:hypothetical protein
MVVDTSDARSVAGPMARPKSRLLPKAGLIMTAPKIEQDKSPGARSKLFYRGTHRARRWNRKPAVLTPEKVPSPSISRAA